MTGVLGFAPTLAKAQAKSCELAKALARGKTRRTIEELSTHIASITRDSWLRRVLMCELTGNTPTTHTLTVTVSETAKEELEEGVFGKRVLVTTQEHRPITDVDGAYRSQSVPDSRVGPS